MLRDSGAVFDRIQSSCRISFEDAADFIADATENSHLLLFRAGGMSRVIEAPVVAVYLTGKHRANLVGIATDGDDGFHILRKEFIEVLGLMMGDVDADFGHRFDGERMNIACRLGSGAGDAEPASRGGAKNAFREMRATGIASAEDENERGRGHKRLI